MAQILVVLLVVRRSQRNDSTWYPQNAWPWRVSSGTKIENHGEDDLLSDTLLHHHARNTWTPQVGGANARLIKAPPPRSPRRAPKGEDHRQSNLRAMASNLEAMGSNLPQLISKPHRLLLMPPIFCWLDGLLLVCWRTIVLLVCWKHAYGLLWAL